MDKGTYVYCTTQFEGFHSWPDAPDEVSYLRDYHRHMFHVKAIVKVTHKNRDVEFITLKSHVDQLIGSEEGRGLASYQRIIDSNRYLSCEQMAEIIREELSNVYKYDVYSVEVSEDGENGAIVVCQ